MEESIKTPTTIFCINFSEKDPTAIQVPQPFPKFLLYICKLMSEDKLLIFMTLDQEILEKIKKIQM
jgi:hypothetical protein